MKKVFFMLLAVIAFSGCSKEDSISVYTSLQENAFSVFNGTWADIQFSNLDGGSLSEFLPDPNLIVFGTHYKQPENVYKDDFMYDRVYLFEKQGECVYHNMPYKDQEYEIIECYYEVSRNADELRFYKRSNNGFYKSFGLSIKSETRMQLQDKNITLPYIFVKQ